MTVGEVISALSLYSSEVINNNKDPLVMAKAIHSIDVHYGTIELYFVDANTPDVKIDKNGERLP